MDDNILQPAELFHLIDDVKLTLEEAVIDGQIVKWNRVRIDFANGAKLKLKLDKSDKTDLRYAIRDNVLAEEDPKK